MGQVASLLRNGQNSGVLQTLWRTCAQQLKDEKLAVRCHALRGFGALAKARAKDDLSKIWQQLVQQVKKILVQIATEDDESAQRLLPDLVVSLADFIVQLPAKTSLSDGDLEVLDDLCGALLAEYRTALNARRFLFERAFYFLLYALHKHGRALSPFLERAVYRNIIFSVQPEFSSGYTPPGVRAIGFQKPQPC